MWLCQSVAILGVLYWGAGASTESMCSSRQRSPALKFFITSQRNKTGHWNAQVQLEHGAGKKDAGPFELEVDHTNIKCQDTEKIFIVASFTGPPQKVSYLDQKPASGYELIPGLGYYKFHSEAKTWHEARDVCVQEGAHLVIINSEREANALLHFWVPYPKLFTDWRNDWAHIGFHDQYVEGEYVTIFDEPLNSTGYIKWLSSQPDALASENCGVAYRGNSNLADVGCGYQLTFFCEQEL